MTTYVMDGQLDGTAKAGGDRTTRLLLVVGFDGSPSAERALRSAVQQLTDRSGVIEVVYVAQAPAATEFSSAAVVATRQALDQEEQVLREQSSSILDQTGLTWHFQRRDGAVAHQLLAATEELAASSGPDDQVVIVLGGSAKRIHHYLSSIPQHVVRSDRFTVAVVP